MDWIKLKELRKLAEDKPGCVLICRGCHYAFDEHSIGSWEGMIGDECPVCGHVRRHWKEVFSNMLNKKGKGILYLDAIDGELEFCVLQSMKDIEEAKGSLDRLKKTRRWREREEAIKQAEQAKEQGGDDEQIHGR